jgi:hypothetical protein
MTTAANTAEAQPSGRELDEALIRAIRQLIAGAVEAEDSDGAVSATR